MSIVKVSDYLNKNYSFEVFEEELQIMKDMQEYLLHHSKFYNVYGAAEYFEFQKMYRDFMDSLKLAQNLREDEIEELSLKAEYIYGLLATVMKNTLSVKNTVEQVININGNLNGNKSFMPDFLNNALEEKNKLNIGVQTKLLISLFNYIKGLKTSEFSEFTGYEYEAIKKHLLFYGVKINDLENTIKEGGGILAYIDEITKVIIGKKTEQRQAHSNKVMPTDEEQNKKVNVSPVPTTPEYYSQQALDIINFFVTNGFNKVDSKNNGKIPDSTDGILIKSLNEFDNISLMFFIEGIRNSRNNQKGIQILNNIKNSGVKNNYIDALLLFIEFYMYTNGFKAENVIKSINDKSKILDIYNKMMESFGKINFTFKVENFFE